MASGKKPTSKRLSKLGRKKGTEALSDKPVVERVPDWLRMLLGKYGEPPGKLAGLQDEYDTVEVDFAAAQAAGPFEIEDDETSAEVSALLEQMAEKGPSEEVDDKSATSVEWGDYPQPEEEAESSSINSFLANLDTKPQEREPEPDYEASDWLGDVVPEKDVEGEQEPAEPVEEAIDAPDWLDEVAPAEKSTPTTPAPVSDYDVPDWLDEALETPEPVAPEMPSEPEPYSEAEGADFAIPDWLTKGLDAAPEAEASPEQPAEHPPEAEPAADDIDIPDWLASMAPPPEIDEAEPPAAAGTPPETKADTQPSLDQPPDWDIPDWISQDVVDEAPPDDTTDTEAAFSDITETEIDDEDIPDWLRQEMEAPSTEASSMEAPSEERPEPEIYEAGLPDWLREPGPEPDTEAEPDIDTEAETDDDDWLANLRAAPADTTGEAPMQPKEEDDDWLAGLDTDMTGDEPDWLTGIAAEPEPETAADRPAPDDQAAPVSTPTEAEQEGDEDDWLSSLRATVPAPAEEQEDTSETWWESDDDSQADDAGIPDWLAGTTPTEVEAEAEADGETPAPSLELADEQPAPASPMAEADDLGLPDWLQEPPEISETTAPDTDTDTDHARMETSAGLLSGADEPETPSAPRPAVISSAAEIETEFMDELPDWLKEDAEDLETPAWLAEGLEAASGSDDLTEIEAELEIPDWLADEVDDDPELAQAFKTAKTPGPSIQPAETVEEEAPEAEVEEPEAPPAPVEATAPTPEARPEIEVEIDGDLPDWLAEAPDDDEFGMPDWLTEPTEEEAGLVARSTAEAAEAEAEEAEETDVPDWLAGTPEPRAPAPEESDEFSAGAMPAWMVDHAEAEEEPAEAAEPEPDMPDWLMDQAGAEEEAAPAPQAEPEPDMPAWMVDRAEAEEEPAEAVEPEPDMPDWLMDQAGAEEEPAPAPQAEPEPDMPAWMVDSAEAEEEPAEAVEIEPEPDMPDWLVDTPQIEEPEQTSPEALETDLYRTDVEEPPAAPVEAEVAPPEPAASEPDRPDWLADIPQAPDTGLFPTPSEQSQTPTTAGDDLPDWLRNLPDPSEADLVFGSTEHLDRFSTQATGAEIDSTMASTIDTPDISTAEVVPDWLMELSTQGKTEPAAVETGPPPDQPADATAIETKEPEPATAEQPETEPTDETSVSTGNTQLLSNLTNLLDQDISTVDEAAPAGEHIPAEADVETIESLADDLPAPGKQEAEISEVPPEALEEAPGWMVDMYEAEEEPESPDQVETPAEADEPDPDLPAMQSGKEAAAAVSRELESPEMADAPDWLADTEATTDTSPPAPAIETDVEAAETTAAPPDFIETAADVEELEVPDWLSEVPGSEEEEMDSSKIEAIEATPDWLADVPDADEDIEPPDWLADFPESDEDSDKIDFDVVDTETPDWLADFSTEPTEAAETETAPEAEAAEPDEPDWLSELSTSSGSAEAEPDETAAAPSIDEADQASDAPDWLANLQMSAARPEIDTEQDETAGTDWLSDLSIPDDQGQASLPDYDVDGEMPDWLSELPTPDQPEAKAQASGSEASADWLSELDIPPEAEAESSLEEAFSTEQEADPSDLMTDAEKTDSSDDSDDDGELPDWLKEASLDDLETPDWLLDEAPEQEEATTTSPKQQEKPPDSDPDRAPPGDWLNFEEEPDLPDWLQEEDDDSKKSEGESLATPALAEPPASEEGSPETVASPSVDDPGSDETDTGSPAPAAVAATVATGAPAPPPVDERKFDTVKSPPIKPMGEAGLPPPPVDIGGEPRLADTIGRLTGVSTFLPVGKATLSSTVTQKSWGGVDVAAQEFYAIATRPPQPATLPAPISRPEKIAGRAIRAGLYLLFILLIALPLLPGLQKVVDEESGLRAPWTEPSREFSDVLDSQRRQLISEQLGIVDLQPPDSVALVSFDYTPATQGEMQPLADAIVGRLKGQGMRIIGMSLQPEGAPLVQQTFDTILAERDEEYGAQMINLGYLPGNVAAVRQLAGGQQILATTPDYWQHLPLAHFSRQNWNDIRSLAQVDVIVTVADNPVTARWWIEQMELAPAEEGKEQYLLAATSASAEPFLTPYRANDQLDGLLAGLNGAAAIEAGRRSFGPARQMIDSQSIAHLLLVILIAVGTIIGWMPQEPSPQQPEPENSAPGSPDDEKSEIA